MGRLVCLGEAVRLVGHAVGWWRVMQQRAEDVFIALMRILLPGCVCGVGVVLSHGSVDLFLRIVRRSGVILPFVCRVAGFVGFGARCVLIFRNIAFFGRCWLLGRAEDNLEESTRSPLPR